jgi:hypothetical protein
MKAAAQQESAWKDPCPSCGQENFTLQLRCGSCGAFVRDRVPALNLFSTLWGMMENPSATLLRIGRSEQKNYTHLLFALCGPWFFALILFLARTGNTDVAFGYMLAGIVLLGPLLGLLLFVFATLSQKAFFRLRFGVAVAYRHAAALVAWSFAPVMWVSVVVLPLQLGVFGPILFSTNPAPWDLLPLPFWIFAILNALSFLWSVILLPLGFRVYGPAYRSVLLQQLPLLIVYSALVLLCARILRTLV